MAWADYYSCDICRCKTFYDAVLRYGRDDEENRNLITGHPWPAGNVGAMIVICKECAKTHSITLTLNAEHRRLIMNKHQELAIEAIKEMIEHNQFHSNLKRLNEMRSQDLQKRLGGQDTKTGVEMIACLEQRIADADAAIEWIKAQIE